MPRQHNNNNNNVPPPPPPPPYCFMDVHAKRSTSPTTSSVCKRKGEQVMKTVIALSLLFWAIPAQAQQEPLPHTGKS